ncbi:MAG: PTS glucose transporter subunit IIA [Candidatus Pristimantibacillus lignocellulolyticus]|uniref:PTS glucose transporter subunit IIA n=1 Tax=Candidatus Pristimantibacillus lignocellulolyticus TaxID=2994561 RepID=A0A9J6ZJ31_9BACL|nr:MAG: PTS glucose transporter subunit IIA [Candidatus Pristimantibacillus lignocellulolyticus]
MFVKRIKRDSDLLSYVSITAPVTGNMFSIDEVQDEAFSRGYMGEGVAFDPIEGTVKAPISGRISYVVETKHAIVIEHASGLQFLIHVGIDTVDLQGEGFEVFVKYGDQVSEGELLITFDLDHIKSAGYKPHVLVVVIGERNIDHIECNFRNVIIAEPHAFRVVLS